MEPNDFILIQVHEEDFYFEVARIRPYITDDKWDLTRGLYCSGIAQNNGDIYEFELHIDINQHKIIELGYPISKVEVSFKISDHG